MIIIGYDCDECKHQRANIDGWKCACDAFPEGIPEELIIKSKPSEKKECNNGIGYEKKQTGTEDINTEVKISNHEGSSHA